MDERAQEPSGADEPDGESVLPETAAEPTPEPEPEPAAEAEPMAAAPTLAPPPEHGISGRTVGLVLTRTVVGLISAAVVAATGFGWWTVGDANEGVATTDVIDDQVATQRTPLDGAVDILLVGMDSRTDAFGQPLDREALDALHAGNADGERNTDTMILVHIPVDGTRATAISFPRDSWVQQAGPYGKHKLNSAFVYAYNDTRKDLAAQGEHDEQKLDEQATVAGRKNLIATIEQLIGDAVTIDRYAEVNLASFYEITKAIGGVDVCLNEAVNEPKSGANFPAGPQTIEGAAALSFVRQRYDLPNGDLDRIVRQQVFLGAIATKVLSANMLTNPSKVRELVGAVKRSVVLSKGWDLTTFADQMSGLSSGKIEFRTIPTQGGARIGGADVIKVDPDEVKAFVSTLITDGKSSTSQTPTSTSDPETSTDPDPSGSTSEPGLPANAITVDVSNASKTKGLAGTVAAELASRGFLRGVVGDERVRTDTVVRYRPGDLDKARLVVKELGGQVSLKSDSTVEANHVWVVLGTDRATEGLDGLTGPAGLAFDPSTSPTTSDTTSDTTSGTSASSTESVPGTRIEAGGVTCVN